MVAHTPRARSSSSLSDAQWGARIGPPNSTVNNTVVDSGTGILVGNDVTMAGNIRVLNNIVVTNDRGISEEGRVA